MSNPLLLSTDTLPNYGLDRVFSIAKEAGYDGIDLAMWKGFDAWDENYVQELALTYDLPVHVIQTSSKLNLKEMDKALDICATTGAHTICVNAPKITDFKVYDFIADNLSSYQEKNPTLKFTIINPETSKLFVLPIPEFRFANIIDIVKKYNAYIGLDISHMEITTFEEEFVRKLEEFLPYISVIYLSDQDKKGKTHLMPGEGDLDIVHFLQKLKKIGYTNPFSVKIEFKLADLANREKVLTQLIKTREFYEKHFYSNT
ncbi:hypothetical protein AGMMS50249_1760 [candidate division SR1 bacterium]|nr:hypothetical protein AGMMS50249_1760 [candidate division SR1 bacterium]